MRYLGFLFRAFSKGILRILKVGRLFRCKGGNVVKYEIDRMAKKRDQNIVLRFLVGDF